MEGLLSNTIAANCKVPAPRAAASNAAAHNTRANLILFHPTRAAAVRGLRCAGLPARRHVAVRASAASNNGDGEQKRYELAVIPAKPKSAVGEMLAYYAKESPHLLKTAIEDQFAKLDEQKRRKSEGGAASSVDDAAASTDTTELTLYRRMEEVRAAELRLQVEDLMYVAVLEKFMELGVEPLPRVDDLSHVESVANLKMLTEGVHSKDAVELVKEHVLGVLGPASMAFSNTMIKMSKLQAAQVYATSLMFGYFLRRVDKRFQLEAALGTLPDTKEDTVDRLNRLFAQAASFEDSDDPDAAPDAPPAPMPSYIDEDGRPRYDEEGYGHHGVSSSSSSSSGSSMDGSVDGDGQPKKRGGNRLRAYVESFDQQALVDTARVLSLEGAAVIETQTSALFGDIKTLQQQMQDAVGGDARSMDEVMQRIQDAVAEGAVESVTMTVGTQRRAVLEAVAFGAFLRDVETHVDSDYGALLTTAPRPNLGGGGGSGPQLLT